MFCFRNRRNENCRSNGYLFGALNMGIDLHHGSAELDLITWCLTVEGTGPLHMLHIYCLIAFKHSAYPDIAGLRVMNSL